MTDFTFSSGISDEVRSATKFLFSRWSSTVRFELPTQFQQALEEGTIDVHARDSLGNTLLHRAATICEIHEIQHLLNHGADPNAMASSSNTPLHSACHSNSLEVVKLFIEHGADWETNGLMDGSVLHSAAKNESHSDVMRYLLDLGADHEARDLSGMTPLHSAISNPNALQALLDAGANCEARSNDNETPLFKAWSVARTPHEQDMLDRSAWLLLAQGANVNVKKNHNLGLLDSLKPTKKLDLHIEAAQSIMDAWMSGKTDPAQLTGQQIMQMLSVWPLADPTAPVPRFEQLETIFSDARWKDEHAEHKLELIGQIPGLSGREHMFLMGGHARTVIQKQNADKKEMER